MKIVNKLKVQFKCFMTGKSGFSLVELIVVIAIMAVMAAVLAPALLGYVERSRAQKDYSAMGEVSNSVQLSLADSSVYDELLVCSEKDNYSCYADGDTTTNIDANKTVTKSPDYWLFNDNARLLDETVYKPAGKMRGVTVTFKPNGKSEYILKDGIVNQIGNESTKKGSNAGKTLVDTNFETLYNKMRSTVGDTIAVSSQTYRNSDYTIFISMGTTGGNESNKQDAIQVYGQYNGTNLPEVAAPIAGESQDAPVIGDENNVGEPYVPIVREGLIPSGGTYYRPTEWCDCGRNNVDDSECNYCNVVFTEEPLVFREGDAFPEPILRDEYEEGDYRYIYKELGDNINSKITWFVRLTDTTRSKSTYGEILSCIAGQPVVKIDNLFDNCKSLTIVPKIPNSVTDMNFTFYGCTALTTAPTIPDSVTSMESTFYGCTNLTTAPVIPNSVTKMRRTFYGCTSLTTAPAISSGVKDMYQTFSDCTSLAIPPDMSNANNVTDMESAFADCKSLTTAPTIPSSVTNMYMTFNTCTSLIAAPDIPSSVKNLYCTFAGCDSLTGTIKIDVDINTHSNYNGCFYKTTKPIILTGSSPILQKLANTANKGNVTVK